MANVKISIWLRRESGQYNWSELFVSCVQDFLWIEWRFHLPANKFRNVLDVENLFFNCLCFFLLFASFFWSLFLFVNGDIFRKSFQFPCLVKEIFKSFSLNKWKLFFNLNEEINFFRLLIGVCNDFFNDFFDLFRGKLDSNTTILFELLQNDTALILFIFQVINGEIKLTGVRNGSTSNVFCKNGTIIRYSFRELGSNGVKHVTNFFLSPLQSRVSNNLKEDWADCLWFGQVGNETFFKTEALTDFNDLVVGLFWHLDIKENYSIKQNIYFCQIHSFTDWFINLQ